MKTGMIVFVSMVIAVGVMVACGGGGSDMGSARTLVERAFAGGELHGVCVVARVDEEPIVVCGGRGDETNPESCAVGIDSRFRIASLTKVLVQIAVLRLVEDSRLDLDAPLASYRPGLDAEWAGRVTIRQLLTFRAGLARERSGATGPVDSGVRYNVAGRASTYLDGLVADGPVVEPGTRTQYSNLGYMHLGAVIEHICDKDVESALRELVFAPAGMTDTGLFGADVLDGRVHLRGHIRDEDGGFTLIEEIPISVRYTAGGFYSTAQDLQRLSLALLGGRLLEESSVALLMNGFGRDDDGRIRAAGLVPGFGSVWYVSSEAGLVVISLNNAVGGSPEGIVETVDSVAAIFERAASRERAADGHEKRLTDEGWIRVEHAGQIPECEILKPALTYLEAVETLDESVIFDAQLTIRHLDRSALGADDIDMYKWLAMYQAALYTRQGPFELAAWRIGEAGALQFYCAGPEGRALRFSFVSKESDASSVASVRVATMGFDPDPDLFESGGPNKIQKR